MNRTDRAAPLSIETTNLTLTVEGVRMAVHSTGDRVFLEVPTVRGAFTVARSLPELTRAEDLGGVLNSVALTTEIRVRGRTVAVLGAEARPGLLSRRLGVAPAEVRVAGILGAVGAEVLAVPAGLRRLFR